MSESLHDEVIRVARDLIRLDTTNAREPGLGNETLCAEYLRDYLTRYGVEAELVAREPHRANLVARIPGVSTSSTDEGAGSSNEGSESLAFVGHTDVVPCDPRDWTHPPFEAVVDDGGWLWGRGAVDMKNEVAARAVAMAELARTGFRPSGDLWFLAVADEEDGFADVGMRWLLQERPDIRPTHSINEGGGERLTLADGRQMIGLSVAEKGTLPVRITAVGEAGHASVPTLGRNAVPLLARLLDRLGDGMPEPSPAPEAVAMLRALLGRDEPDLELALAEAEGLYDGLGDTIRSLMGSTLAPTRLWGSSKLNVMPARATVEVDIRILPGTTESDVEAQVRDLLGDDLPYELEWPEAIIAASSSPVSGVVPSAVAAFLEAEGDPGTVMPTLCTGFTDSNYLRAAAGTRAYGFSPFRATPNDVLEAGYHNANERVHVDDLLLSTRFHLDLAQRVLGVTGTPYPEPAPTDDLRGVLLDYLDFYRGVVAAKLDGLGEGELTGSVVPSGWTPAGLVHHLVNVERRWLVWGFLGEALTDPWLDTAETGGWVTLDVPVEELREMLDEAAVRTRTIVEGHELTEQSQLTGRFRDRESAPLLQWILLHLVQEYARHLGHLDIARELIDGRTGEEG